ncbi:MAG TPA: RNA polymerase sigma factor, partial [Magnetococcales bacterium]|nr:RNA polymerase sigma factor [Magnetococcales bacterium]
MTIGRGPDPDIRDVEAAKKGDIQAFSQLLKRLEQRVFRFILRHSLTNEDAQDLTQETFLEVHRNLNNFRGNSMFSTWVLGISRNLVLNHINRSSSFRFASVDDSDLADVPDDNEDPHEACQRQDRLTVLRQGLQNHLSQDLREALMLVCLEGLSYREAARLLELPEATVKTRVFRARKALRAGFAAEGHEELFTLD